VTTLYGIKNCDTVKKAKNWLESSNIDFQFHDFRVDGLEEKQLSEWVKELGWEVLVNKRSTTWKQLDNKTRDTMDESLAIITMLAHPTLIKRPVLDTGHERLVGFKDSDYQALFKHHTL
jgi:arsenate reductase